MGSYVHTPKRADGETELHPSEFENGEAVEFLYPAIWKTCLMLHTTHNTDGVPSNLKQGWKHDIMQYEKQLVEDLKQIPEEKQNEYVSAYHSKFSPPFGQFTMCQSNGDRAAKFNCQRNNKALTHTRTDLMNFMTGVTASRLP